MPNPTKPTTESHLHVIGIQSVFPTCAVHDVVYYFRRIYLAITVILTDWYIHWRFQIICVYKYTLTSNMKAIVTLVAEFTYCAISIDFAALHSETEFGSTHIAIYYLWRIKKWLNLNTNKINSKIINSDF